MDFNILKQAIAHQFVAMSDKELFRTDISKDELWATYLGSFPEGSNPIYRERTEHDCNSCKQFIRTIGNVVAIVNGQLISLWDVQVEDPNYQAVANAMAALVKSQPIANVFRHTEPVAGVDKNFEDVLFEVKRWDHLFAQIPAKFVVSKHDLGTVLGEFRSTYDVFARGLKEITPLAIETVLDLIAQNSIYRGAEFKAIVQQFSNCQRDYLNSPTDNDIWQGSRLNPMSVTRIRNSAIGTLMVDLSEGMDLESAVKSFEAKVAPQNYKRPTAIVSKRMIEDAKRTVEELGLTSALERRYATINDITINNILFADRSTPSHLSGNVFDQLSQGTPIDLKSFDKIEEVSIDKFLSNILPTITSLEVLMENKHVGNLVSLIAPVDPIARQLFKWDNRFSWSYNGEVADSIKERVKQAGGNITGDLCCRLAWFNYDDLDFHMLEPDGYHIYFASRNRLSHAGGLLDVDMNAGRGTTREAVENIYYSQAQRMTEGMYTLYVHNFSKREAIDVGFEVEVDFKGQLHKFAYEKAVRDGDNVTVMKFKYTHKGGFQIIESLPESSLSKQVWGMQTNAFHKANVVMFSPNYWDGHGVGNQHFFFMLEGCKNADKARGFFNEFLIQDLDKHRKVIEMVGTKMRTDESPHQLSGLGFSSTQRNHLICRVEGSFRRVIKIIF